MNNLVNNNLVNNIKVFTDENNQNSLSVLIFYIVFIIVSMIYLRHKYNQLSEKLNHKLEKLNYKPIVNKIEKNLTKADNFILKKIYSRYTRNDNKIDVSQLYLTPVQAGFLLEREVKIHHIIATILHFLDIGIIKLEKIYRNDKTYAYRLKKNLMEFCNYNLYTDDVITEEKKERIKKKGISISEICIIDRIVFKYYNNINVDRIFQLYDSVDDFSALYNLNEINELKELELDKQKVENCINKEFFELGLYEKKSQKHFFEKFEYLAPTSLYGQKAISLAEYKDKLLDDTLLSERCIENIYLWGEHLIYGVALKACIASIQDAIEIYEDKREK